jgi:hypothetical protein
MLPEMRPKVAMQSLMGGFADGGHFEGQEVLEAVVAGIPAMADFIAAMPDGQRAIALDALERHYLQTAQNFTPCWASTHKEHPMSPENLSRRAILAGAASVLVCSTAGRCRGHARDAGTHRKRDA